MFSLFSLCICLLWWLKLRVGIDIPTIEVRFEHLRVEAEAYIGQRALPTIFNFFANLMEVRTTSLSYVQKFQFNFFSKHHMKFWL